MEIQEKNRHGIPLWNTVLFSSFWFFLIPYCNSFCIPLKYAYLLFHKCPDLLCGNYVKQQSYQQKSYNYTGVLP